ncbi:hypothetical protein U5B43_02915 [Campylobacter sp. 9BO]|uniref:hypothetical protein n=1 Tax=Campylobacter sp. 9BO TaxID=3424759 RepID=UPI003D3414B2
MTDEQLVQKFSELSAQITELSHKQNTMQEQVQQLQRDILREVKSIKSAMPAGIFDTLNEIDRRFKAFDYKFFKI